jgi:TRAP-type C4-dicarboxylate transport system substrate-binding protein
MREVVSSSSFLNQSSNALTRSKKSWRPSHLLTTISGMIIFAMMIGVSLVIRPGHAIAAEVWDCYVDYPVASAPNVQGVQKMLDEIAKQSNGALTIRMHLGGSLPINVTNMSQAVSDNIIQMGDDAFFGGYIPIGSVMRLPMLIQSETDFDKAAAIMQPYIADAYAKKGVVFLGQYTYPQSVPFSHKKLTSVADLKDQKIRPTSPEQGEFLKSFGGISVSFGAPEVPGALDRGVIDGVVTSSAVGGRAWKEMLKYRLDFPIGFGNSNIIVNKDAFDRLSPELQALVRKVVTEQTRWIEDTMEAQDNDATRELAAGGMVTTTATPDEIASAYKLMVPYWDQWAKAKGPVAVEALAKVKAGLGR